MKIILLAVFLAIASTSIAEKKIVCYYESWATYRNGDGKYSIEDINVPMCTHVVYSFIGIDESGTITVDTTEYLSKFTSFVKKQPGVKAMVSVGGASVNPGKFSNVVRNAGIRASFVRNAVNFLQQYNFDGLDVDWEYPNQGAGTLDSDKTNFVQLLKELKDAFNGKYILSAAVAATPDSAGKSYIIPQISTHLDFINVMTYDFNGAWNPYTGMNSPLNPSSGGTSYEKTLNVKTSIDYWLSQGAPADKIVVGIPFYGRSYTLKNPGDHGVRSPTTGPGAAGPFTKQAGYIGYNELCLRLMNGNWHVVRSEELGVPYTYFDNQWISYDDADSIRKKIEFINSKGLGGAMIWNIDLDDFRGNCGSKYPLLSTVNNVLKR
ncbi:acidic mammalian chitinase-like [Xylocopa sonorina]|uniref:acidic mammalian chitinase-like n=1 Tax=Xylocopa sonorina TaxID=1818115 RepID=UPI00403B0BE4